MLKFLLNKLVLIVPTFIGITIVAFGFVRVLPGDPILALAGERGVEPERYQQLLTQFGFDRPIWEQYFTYVIGLFQGDFGTSIATKRPVLDEFLTLFPATVELATCAIIFAIVIGIPAGIISAVKRGSWFDQLTMGTAPRWLFNAYFLVGPFAHYPVFRHTRLDTCFRSHIADVFLPAGNRLYADR